ncbi:sugar ABC transporter substrate-binding protein [Micrococcales bacterium 31B]|nr:sugar ABC transporter substrate-binding protein [Micrococcales bacterium 31B]
MNSKKVIAALGVVAALSVTLTACNRGTDAAAGGSGSSGAAATVTVGLDYPRADSDFWKAYGTYVPAKATEVGGIDLQTTSSNNDTAALSSNMQTLTAKGAKALVIAPQDTAAIGAAVKKANDANIPVVSVDTIPDEGNVNMVVRADNEAYGTNSCIFLGEKLGGQGKVAVLQGDTASINGRDRSNAFDACMKEKYPNMQVINLPTKWDPATGATMLATTLTQNPDLGGIYMQASIYMDSTFQTLKAKNKLIPAGQEGHVVIVSNDGVKAEYDAIARGDMDATISQPADLYAQYGLFYAKAFAEGKTFSEGPTDHNSTIVKVREGVLQDLLPAPVVTKDGGKVGELDTVATTDPNLWGNQ